MTDVVGASPASTAVAADSDEALITAARDGDDEAVTTLYERHVGAARAAAVSLVGAQPAAEDLVSEAFTRVLRALRQGGGPQVAFRPYLLTCVRNAAYDRSRRDRRLVLVPQPDDTVGGAIELDDPAVAESERQFIAHAYNALPERWRAVLWHTEVEGMSAANVGPMLGISPNAVAALAYRAREGLRQGYLQAHLAEGAPDACRFTTDRLGRYVRGGLSRFERRRVDKHLAHCDRCRALAGELRTVDANLHSVLVPLLIGGSVSAAGYLGHLAGSAGVAGTAAAGTGSSTGTGAGAGTGTGAGTTGGSVGTGATTATGAVSEPAAAAATAGGAAAEVAAPATAVAGAGAAAGGAGAAAGTAAGAAAGLLGLGAVKLGVAAAAIVVAGGVAVGVARSGHDGPAPSATTSAGESVTGAPGDTSQGTDTSPPPPTTAAVPTTGPPTATTVLLAGVDPSVPVTGPGATPGVSVTVPGGGEVTVTVTVPDATVPNATVPGVTVPGVTVPGVTVPDVTVPDDDVTVPDDDVTVPDDDVPDVTVPQVTTPPVTTPQVTTPRVTTPPLTTPRITVP